MPAPFKLRDPRWFLIVSFLGILGGVPAVQLCLDFRAGEAGRVLDLFTQVPTAAHLRHYERNLESANWAARLSRPWMQLGLFAGLRDGGAKALPGREGWLFYKPGLADLTARPVPLSARNATNDPVAAITDFRDQLAARGIQLLVVPVPNKESTYPDHVASSLANQRSLVAPRTRDALDRLRAANVEVIDLFSVFRAARDRDPTDDTPLYLAQDTHWSPAGMLLAARTVARRLVELGWARPGNHAYDIHPTIVQRPGDIVRMLKSPPLEGLFAPESVTCLRVVEPPSPATSNSTADPSAKSGGGQTPYQDSADAEILVLGDSFLRIYHNDTPGAAGFIAHLAHELRQPLLSVVNDGGGATLLRKELQSRPAYLRNRKVVIWEFVERDLGLATEGWPKLSLSRTQ